MYLPLAQLWQDDASAASEYFPLAQALHDVAAACEYVPGLHVRQAVAASAYFPLLQALHDVAASCEYAPGLHVPQIVAAPVPENLPAVQSVQVVFPVLEPLAGVT